MTNDYKVRRWYPWHGGYQPVPGATIVSVFYRDGDIENNIRAVEIIWNHTDDDDDVIAFCVEKTRPKT